jgi:ketosteroid isomerase-like protein
MKRIIFLSALFFSLIGFSQTNDEVTIRQVLDSQTESWNKGDIKGFMQGYWKDDSLMFIGKNGIHWGWQTTLENYKKNYPDRAAMGKLSFDIILVKKLSPEYFYVVGKWMLSRSIGDLSGHYNLLFKKINGQWLIIADHSS